MPLHTQIVRDGEPLKLRWSDFHVAAMVQAAAFDSGRGPYADMDSFQGEVRALMEKQGAIGVSPSTAWQLAMYPVIGATPLNEGPYTIQSAELKFVDNTDGEVLEIKPGDVLHAMRGF